MQSCGLRSLHCIFSRRTVPGIRRYAATPLDGLCLQRGQRDDPGDSIRGKRLAQRMRRFLGSKPQSLVFSIAPPLLPLTPGGQAVVKNLAIVLANDDAPTLAVSAFFALPILPPRLVSIIDHQAARRWPQGSPV